MIDKTKASARSQRWRKKNPEKAREISRRAAAKKRRERPEAIKAYQAGYRERNREALSAADRERRFGIDLATYSAMVAEQDNKCAICRRWETATRHGKVKALAVDHDHKTGKVRGLLCSDCNTGIGKLGEDRDRMLSAIKYLDGHSGAAAVVQLKAVE